jgi:hypothetical protein
MNQSQSTVISHCSITIHNQPEPRTVIERLNGCVKVIYKPQRNAKGTFCKASKHNFLILRGKSSAIIRTRPSVYTNPRKKMATSTNGISYELHVNQLLQHGEFMDLYQININVIA